jgi:cobalt-precorrin-5B (C1)-methyltransferase
MSELKHGYTTGTCAAAAAKAAAALLAGLDPAGAAHQVCLELPDGDTVCLPLTYVRREGGRAVAAVRKDAGDDPDVTHGALVVATVAFRNDDCIEFTAGDGVGTVTRPGLSIAPGEPAINPTPRRMIRQAIRQVTARGVQVEIAIPGGRQLAARTFNPRLGVVGGLSILGNSGRVRPFSHAAIQATVGCAMDVAAAGAIRHPVLVPGRIGEKAARKHFKLTPEQIVEVSNEWGYAFARLAGYAFEGVLIVGHPGKLAKLAQGQFQTHSSRSGSPVEILARFGTRVLGRRLAADSATTEALMALLNSCERTRLANALAETIARAAAVEIGVGTTPAVFLADLRGEQLGTYGDLAPWRK